MTSYRKQEILLYTVIWGIVFTLVPLVLALNTGMGDRSVWRELPTIWLGILPFLALFIAHDFAATHLLIKRRYAPYALVTLALLVLFAIYCFSFNHRPPEMLPEEEFFPPRDIHRPMVPEFLKLMIGILTIGVNVGAKAVFGMLENERKVQALKAESLHQQLETLRYQINPHFFMNTLNNIHALVDIDPEKAKESIEEFSKLMRIVLYDGDTPTIPLEKEIEFLRHYISLMRLRYPESVEISLTVPEKAEGKVPPLVMASFVENAFKHGVSYEARSFIRTSVAEQDGKVIFKCANSRHPAKEDPQHGLGLENIRRRLDLLYGSGYTLYLDNQADVFEAVLVIPSGEKEEAL